MREHGPGKDIIYVAVVDDDDSLCRSLSRLLRTAGFQPVSYPSAEAFLEDVKRPRFDCLVLDIQLGGMSGLELSRRLSAVRDATPVIFITAHEEPQMQSEALAGGCGGFFHKNTPGTLIMEAIRNAVRNARGNQLNSARTDATLTNHEP
jgi:FixJ family two-component response regulator